MAKNGGKISRSAIKTKRAALRRRKERIDASIPATRQFAGLRR